MRNGNGRIIIIVGALVTMFGTLEIIGVLSRVRAWLYDSPRAVIQFGNITVSAGAALVAAGLIIMAISRWNGSIRK